jgi:hypothetical protein
MTEPTPLPPFSGDDARCPKCGNEGAYTEYKAKGEPGHGRITLGSAGPERLERCCSRCDYRWDEALATPAKESP